MEKDTWIDKLSRTSGRAAAVMIVPAILFSAWEVFARYLFSAPTNWVFPSVIALCAMSYVLSGPYLLQRNEFIRVTYIYDKFSPRGRYIVDLVSAIFEMFWAITLTVASGMQAYSAVFRMRGGAWKPETLSGAWSAPIPALVRSVLFLACLILALQAVLGLVRRIKSRRPAPVGENSYVD